MCTQTNTCAPFDAKDIDCGACGTTTTSTTTAGGTSAGSTSSPICTNGSACGEINCDITSDPRCIRDSNVCTTDVYDIAKAKMFYWSKCDTNQGIECVPNTTSVGFACIKKNVGCPASLDLCMTNALQSDGTCKLYPKCDAGETCNTSRGWAVCECGP